ncbi:TM2 domain-containing protein [Comamonas sp. Y33R10-2]|uniref:TM2 domain-containing protein n=1 Tax=Comamonas sp. Y33R10-2 TaxID=2853257 RepID=UPI001C5CB6EA|nr:TM2 domain-containing protein [Comamonas sp. Y33R10-2]QXZ10030.1 TM2 domain-containing protein [Comamonas sp. Y33R10-2]
MNPSATTTTARSRSKNKTLAAWLAFVGGPLGLHRFYLYGMGDWLGWLLPIPTALGIYGIERIQQLGQDDQLSWILIPLFGFTIAGCALRAILYGLMDKPVWNARFNPSAAADATAGQTQWTTIFAIALSLLFGATVLMASIAYSFQHYFEYQVQEARKISQ